MAASPRMRILSPVRLWFVLNITTLILLGIASWTVLRVHDREATRVANASLETLIRSGMSLLERGDYRGFVESTGLSRGDYSINLVSPVGSFTFPPPVDIILNDNSSPGYCTSRSVNQPGSQSVDIQLCYTGTSLKVFFFWLYAGYLAVLFATFFVARVIETSAFRAVSDLVRSCGVTLDDERSLAGLIAKMSHIAEDASRARAAETSAAAAHAQSAMALRVAHDIRSPLRVISNIMTQGSPVGNEWPPLLESSVLRIGRVADSLLQFYKGNKNTPSPTLVPTSRFWQGTNSEEIKPVDICKLSVEAVEAKRIEMLTSQSRQVQLELRTTTDQIFVRSNSDELTMIISNLLNNALESDANRITLDLSEDPISESAIIQICDTGPGFSHETLQSISKGIPSSSKTTGHGIGLSAAREAITGWGGRLIARNGEKGGAIVEIQLPLVKSAPHKTADVALLDDDPFVVDDWARAAKKSAIRFNGFHNVEHFLEWVNSQPRSLKVYLDIHLQTESGYSVAEKLHKMGFRDIRYATSLPADAVESTEYVLETVGKDAPF